MKYTWIEQDNSDTKTELSIGVTSKFDEGNTTVTNSVKATIGAKDDEAGEAVVEYKDRTSILLELESFGLINNKEILIYAPINFYDGSLTINL